MIKAVIFDLDGTLIDSMGIWKKVDIDFLKKRNIAVPEHLFNDFNGGNSFNDLAVYFKEKFSLKESLDEIKNEWHQMVEEYYRKELEIKDNAIDVLNLLKDKNIKLAIGTSNSEYLTREVLKLNHIEDYFSSISCGCHDIKGKPYPDIFMNASSELAVEAENCLVIEDSLPGVQAAKNAGMMVFSIFDEHCGAELNDVIHQSDRHFNNHKELYEYLRENL
ncbi:MAG TPA: HAD family phosphatase [Candidatus Cloacimonadota bacterium]|nr:HAD family phosphatase [Candidatus Cloacimonadota bacterium]